MPDEAVLAVRARYARGGISQAELAVEYDTSETAVACAIRGDSYAHLPLQPRRPTSR
jgi:hypothetical protein